MIKVKRNRDGKVFTIDMSEKETIYEIHFCTSYTQVRIQEHGENGPYTKNDIFVKPIGTKTNCIDQLAFDGTEDWGEWL